MVSFRSRNSTADLCIASLHIDRSQLRRLETFGANGSFLWLMYPKKIKEEVSGTCLSVILSVSGLIRDQKA